MKHALYCSLMLLVSLPLFSQGILKKLKESNPVSNVLEGKKPITTSFKDVKLDGKLDASHGEGVTYTPLHSMHKSETGAYTLTPGYYEVTSFSYCLKAGTNGPSKGDAYGLAYLEGKMDEIVEAIITNSQQYWRERATKDSAKTTVAKALNNIAGISQRDVQLLLWAIIAKADFNDMGGRTKAVAVALLSPEQLLKLNGGAVKTVANFASDKGWLDKPEWLRKIEEAEQNLRGLYQRADATYEDFERLAVLAGAAAEPNPVDAGTWFKHADGYFIRFEAHGYSRTTVKVYVPEGKTVSFTATGMVATPSDSRQRLAQTDITEEEYAGTVLKK